ncbi:MAG: sigma-54-dependent Fis family transcriptional regulator [Desulfobacterales bacterium]|nr:sigma-54-dependent Fis family transcriptional regulator [Desulfobacterales bacterium]
MKILIVDDDDMQRKLLAGFLKKKGYEIYEAKDGNDALKLFIESFFHLVILDHKMPGMFGDEVLEKIKAINPFIRSIMITAFGTVDTAVKVMKLGADDFFEKPINLSELLDKIQFIEQSLAIEEDIGKINEEFDESSFPLKVIGSSHELKEVLSMVKRVAKSPWSVLIRGETGTGKELISRLIHLLSDRKEKPFIVVNCGSVPENLFEAELFGHEKGSFTGAISNRKGRFELANEGTLFLDEIGELPLSLQPKLLRALQEKQIIRVGGEKEILVDVRVIAATNKDLKQMVEEGFFREDLYYRLNVFDVEIPPLRKRKEDIPALVDFFLEKYTSSSIKFSTEAMDLLMKYSFPGNVRELEHIIQRTITLTRGSIITEKDIPVEVRLNKYSNQSTLIGRISNFEKEMILASLEKNSWIQTKAANALGISERVLRYKMGKYDIQRQSKI